MLSSFAALGAFPLRARMIGGFAGLCLAAGFGGGAVSTVPLTGSTAFYLLALAGIAFTAMRRTSTSNPLRASI